MKSRFAPTPSGFLHQGNLLNMLLIWLWVRHHKGQILLRIDDMDRLRFRTEYLDFIFRAIDWLGLDYDQGPYGSDDFETKWSQRHRMGQYYVFFERLKHSGNLFACNCSRKKIRSMTGKGAYNGYCLNNYIASCKPDAWRFNTTGMQVHEGMQHFVVWQKSNLPAYQLFSLADDVFFEVDTIIRGSDLAPSTTAQLALATQLDLSFTANQFFHHPVIHLGAQKISKSAGGYKAKVGFELTAANRTVFFKNVCALFNWPVAVSAAALLQTVNTNDVKGAMQCTKKLFWP